MFSTLKVWRDLDQDGVADAGEMMTLAEAGIVSISLTRADVAGTNSGHDVGYEGLFTRADGTTGSAQTIYFQTDRQDTRADNTPNFTPAEGVDKPVNMRSSVDFPEPEGPSKATISPAVMERSVGEIT